MYEYLINENEACDRQAVRMFMYNYLSNDAAKFNIAFGNVTTLPLNIESIKESCAYMKNVQTYCRLSHLVDRVMVSWDQLVTLIPFYSVKHAHHSNSAYR